MGRPLWIAPNKKVQELNFLYFRQPKYYMTRMTVLLKLITFHWISHVRASFEKLSIDATQNVAWYRMTNSFTIKARFHHVWITELWCCLTSCKKKYCQSTGFDNFFGLSYSRWYKHRSNLQQCLPIPIMYYLSYKVAWDSSSTLSPLTEFK